jgi:hypothetical protein
MQVTYRVTLYLCTAALCVRCKTVNDFPCFVVSPLLCHPLCDAQECLSDGHAKPSTLANTLVMSL